VELGNWLYASDLHGSRVIPMGIDPAPAFQAGSGPFASPGSGKSKEFPACGSIQEIRSTDLENRAAYGVENQ
jgi:hypothetical protein